MIEIEELAKELHEAGREAVEKGATVAADIMGSQNIVKFREWDQISETAREGRIIQARYLLAKYTITPREQ